MHPGSTLTDAIRAWPTPTTGESVSGHGRRGVSGKGQASRDLEAQARSWPTPAAWDVKGANTNDTHSMDQLANVTARWPGPRGPRMLEAGDPPSLSTPRLNPRFVEWLMGFPIGWTAFDALETEWSRWRRLMRSEISRLAPDCPSWLT
jgi:DNA (cytosine-5)-methyltransferase 1